MREKKLETSCLSNNSQINHQNNPPNFENVKCFECENWGHFRENCEMFKKRGVRGKPFLYIL